MPVSEITDEDVEKFLNDNQVSPGDRDRIFVTDPETGQKVPIGLDISDPDKVIPLALNTTDGRVLVLRVRSGVEPDFRPRWYSLHGPFTRPELQVFIDLGNLAQPKDEG